MARKAKKQMQNAQPCKSLYHESEHNSTKLFCRKAGLRLSPALETTQNEHSYYEIPSRIPQDFRVKRLELMKEQKNAQNKVASER